MTQDEAQNQILLEWESWKIQNPRGNSLVGGWYLAFFAWLQSDRQHLLNFRCRGDKWQRVKGWIQNYEGRTGY